MIESMPSYQIHSELGVITVRSHRVTLEDEIVFDYEIYDPDEDCLVTLTPEQARKVWNILMEDLETICHSSTSQSEKAD